MSSGNDIKMDRPSFPVPFPHAYWVIPEKLIVGAYPGSKREERAKFFVSGISQIINLVEDDERGQAGKPLPNYYNSLSMDAKRHLATISVSRKPIKYGTVPSVKTMKAILDKIDVAISRGRRVYVHSRNGRGRVGTVVGCYLVRHGMMGDEALEWVRILRMAKPTGHLTSPETEDQRKMVLNWKG
jgi:hypothetical protein